MEPSSCFRLGSNANRSKVVEVVEVVEEVSKVEEVVVVRKRM